MMSNDEASNTRNFITTNEAAEILGVSYYTVYEYIKEGRLPADMVGGSYMIPKKAVEAFKPKPTGRVRTEPTRWRSYRSGASVRGMEIRVRIREGQQEQLAQKILAMREQQQHLFPGTMQRYMFTDETHPVSLLIVLIWKNTELPDETTLDSELDAFKQAFADVLDWETAQYSVLDASAYT